MQIQECDGCNSWSSQSSYRLDIDQTGIERRDHEVRERRQFIPILEKEELHPIDTVEFIPENHEINPYLEIKNKFTRISLGLPFDCLSSCLSHSSASPSSAVPHGSRSGNSCRQLIRNLKTSSISRSSSQRWGHSTIFYKDSWGLSRSGCCLDTRRVML